MEQRNNMAYDFRKIEKKWQKKWEEGNVFEVKTNLKKKKYYVADMFPYPSGEGLHIGHAFVFSLADIFSRFKRMQGFNLMYPIGYDSLGLPAENAAIRVGTHPKKYTEKSMKNFMKQQKAMGWSYDWSRMFKTSDSSFYKWDQWIFLKMFEKGLAYQKSSAVNWCPKCNTVLANEQVHNGKCEYHPDTDVEMKYLKQWFFRITDYAEELVTGLDNLNWPLRAKIMQRNWIGKSYGTEIDFEINGEKFPVFTTRPDTIFGVTFMVISAQHTRLMEFVAKEQKKEVEKFLKKLKSVSEKELEHMDKEGVFTGSYAINPITKEKVPVYAGNFVVADYGSGMVMAVPAHDQRDFDFAKKYGIEIKEVIEESYNPEDSLNMSHVSSGSISLRPDLEKAYPREGTLIFSGDFTGLNSEEAKEKITKYLEKKKVGRKKVQFRLRDWLISRQRYWGTPIPIVYCDKCGVVPVSEKNLPIELPKKVKFGDGNPLKTAKDWVNVRCPKCKGNAKRETDTMDTFVNSSWYLFRYCDSKNDKEIFDKKKVNYWCPVDLYIGGPEHITMHLIYFRFYTKFLRDLGLLKFDEPTKRYFTQGIVKASDGDKMSKSKGNIVEPLDMIGKYGADALRFYLVSNSSPDRDFDWDDKGMESTFKFIKKLFNYFESVKIGKSNPKIESKLNKAIKEITSNIEDIKYNFAVIKLRELFEYFPEEISKDALEKSLKLLHPFCPHITEELWEKIGGKGFISLAKWPEVDESKIDENLEKQEQAVEKLIDDLNHVLKLMKEKESKEYEKGFVYVLPNEKNFIEESIDLIKKKTRLNELSIFAVNDKDKYDPEGKSKKVKPGRPGIYLE